MSSFRQNYSEYYDSIHGQKNYAVEAKKITELILNEFPNNNSPRVLDFGCGTGNHLNEIHLLSKGIILYGYDKSEYMVNIAKQKYPMHNFATNLDSFTNNFDLVYSLFDVVNYQITDNHLIDYFTQIFSKLRIGGVFILDSWNYDGLRISPPENRERNFDYDGKKLRRIVESSSENDYKITDLEISILEHSTDLVLSKERHSIRAFDQDELENFALECGFQECSFANADNWNAPLGPHDWRLFMKAKKLS